MERIVIVGLLFCLGHNFVCAKTEYYFVIGKSLELRPPPGVTKIENIAWRHKGNFVAEWAKGTIPLEIYPAFKGRTALDTKTGYLKIDRMTADDAGEFSVEINSNKLDELYTAKDIEEVPVPRVWVKPDGDDFVLSCEAKNGEKIKNPEYITYFWNIGGGDQNWTEREQRVKINNNNETMRVIKTFACKMVNPVSAQESEPIDNPLQKHGSSNSGAVAAGVSVSLLVAAAGVGLGLGYWKRNTLSSWWARVSGTNGAVNPDTNAEVATPLADKGQNSG